MSESAGTPPRAGSPGTGGTAGRSVGVSASQFRPAGVPASAFQPAGVSAEQLSALLPNARVPCAPSRDVPSLSAPAGEAPLPRLEQEPDAEF